MSTTQRPRPERANRATKGESRTSFLSFVVSVIVLLLIWQGCVVFFKIPAYLLPAPSDVCLQVYRDIATGIIFASFFTTLIEVVVGFLVAVIAAILLGSAIALVPIVDRLLYPYVLILQTIPKIAVAPLFLIWFGYGVQSKIITAALIAFFPILVNVIAGLKTVDNDQLLLMKALRANRVQVFTKVRLPNLLPYLFAGLEVAIIFSLIGAIVGEFIGSSVGLGSLIIQRQGSVNVAGVFSILFFLSIMGLSLNAILRLVAQRFAFWSRTNDNS